MFNVKKFNSKKFNLERRKKQGFTTVEILVAVGLVAILMVVAVPRLLGTRQSVGDSAAKQQLNTVGVAVNNWFVERDTFTGIMTASGTPAETPLQKRVPEIKIVGENDPTGKMSNGRALMVGAKATDTEVVLVASNGDNNCWGMKFTKAGTEYAYALATPSDCKAASTSWTKTWQKFEFPNAE
jgi:type II secretory pathway pseudopilin PulG